MLSLQRHLPSCGQSFSHGLGRLQMGTSSVIRREKGNVYVLLVLRVLCIVQSQVRNGQCNKPIQMKEGKEKEATETGETDSFVVGSSLSPLLSAPSWLNLWTESAG